jgi:hypothetical protein
MTVVANIELNTVKKVCCSLEPKPVYRWHENIPEFSGRIFYSVGDLSVAESSLLQ